MRRTRHAIHSTPLMAMASRLSMRLCRCPCASLRRMPGHHPDAQHDQREADQPLRPVIQTLRQSHVQLQHRHAQHHHRECVTERVRHPQPQSAAPVLLHGGDIRDGGQMIVVEAVPQPQHKAGAERGISFQSLQIGVTGAQYSAALIGLARSFVTLLLQLSRSRSTGSSLSQKEFNYPIHPPATRSI